MGPDPRVICNLAMGGTNPHEIERLMKLSNVSVRQSDKLHGKVYRFKESVLIGSANASANGLSFEGNELNGWHEAGLATSDQSVLIEVDKWEAALSARDITSNDIKVSRKRWSIRRVEQGASSESARQYIDWLREPGSNFYKDRQIYLVAYVDDKLSPEAEVEATKVEKELGTDIDYYEDWEYLPDQGILISFLVKKNGEIDRIDGLRQRIGLNKRGARLELCKKIANSERQLEIDEKSWQNILHWFVQLPLGKWNSQRREGWDSDNGAGFVNLEQVALAVRKGEIRLR